jgi:selenocysteine-specific translation elongation factor
MPSHITRALTAAVLTDVELASKLGKKGTETDMTIFDHKKNEFVLSAVVPHRFPEKLPPLLFALGMADAVVISAKELSRTLAEEVVATDFVAPPSGIICTAGGVTADQLAPLLKGTALEKYPVVASHFEVLDFLTNVDRRYRRCDGTVVLVDQAFEVKGVGTVVLGKVHGGPVKVHQKLRVSPGGGEVQVRSIQIHDDDHPEGPVGTRVGLALRGTDAKALPRGTVLDAGGKVDVSDVVEGEFALNKFFKPPAAAGQVVHALCGLDATPGRIESIGGGRAKLKLERPMARVAGIPVVVASLDAPGSKIIGAFR